MSDSFLELIKEYNGFEFTLGFRDNEDHFIGGTGKEVWYCITKGNYEECWIAEYDGENRSDRHYVIKKKDVKEEPAEPGKTIQMITGRAYFKQDELAASGRKPVQTTVSGHVCSHYVFSFGARAYDVSDKFGITVSYSNIDDETAGYRLRNITLGKDVKPPKIK